MCANVEHFYFLTLYLNLDFISFPSYRWAHSFSSGGNGRNQMKLNLIQWTYQVTCPKGIFLRLMRVLLLMFIVREKRGRNDVSMWRSIRCWKTFVDCCWWVPLFIPYKLKWERVAMENYLKMMSFTWRWMINSCQLCANFSQSSEQWDTRWKFDQCW